MWKKKLCLGVNREFNATITEQIEIFHKVGFEGFFLVWQPDINMQDVRKYADARNMFFQSIHAPFQCTADIWKEGKVAEVAVKILIDCLEVCAEHDVPIMVCHCYIGFEPAEPTQVGVENFRRVVERAKKLGVKIAFENCEQEQFLAKIMETFLAEEHVGFCWDTGHEMCYNRSKEMMRLYGDRIICTHLNDNLGIRSNDGVITFLDDLHLLPFDGIADWDYIVEQLAHYKFDDVLTFELNKHSKPGRHDNDIYQEMSLERYVCEAYKRACKVAAMLERKQGLNK